MRTTVRYSQKMIKGIRHEIKEKLNLTLLAMIIAFWSRHNYDPGGLEICPHPEMNPWQVSSLFRG